MTTPLTTTYLQVIPDDEAQHTFNEVYDQIVVWMEEDDRHARETRAQHKEATAGPEEAAAAS